MSKYFPTIFSIRTSIYLYKEKGRYHKNSDEYIPVLHTSPGQAPFIPPPLRYSLHNLYLTEEEASPLYSWLYDTYFKYQVEAVHVAEPYFQSEKIITEFDKYRISHFFFRKNDGKLSYLNTKDRHLRLYASGIEIPCHQYVIAICEREV